MQFECKKSQSMSKSHIFCPCSSIKTMTYIPTPHIHTNFVTCFCIHTHTCMYVHCIGVCMYKNNGKGKKLPASCRSFLQQFRMSSVYIPEHLSFDQFDMPGQHFDYPYW